MIIISKISDFFLFNNLSLLTTDNLNISTDVLRRNKWKENFWQNFLFRDFLPPYFCWLLLLEPVSSQCRISQYQCNFPKRDAVKCIYDKTYISEVCLLSSPVCSDESVWVEIEVFQAKVWLAAWLTPLATLHWDLLIWVHCKNRYMDIWWHRFAWH